MKNWKIFSVVSLAFLGFEAFVLATPIMPGFLDVITYFLFFVALAAAGYFALGFLTGSWYSLLVALIPLAAMYAIGFNEPFAGFDDPEYTVAPMKEAWIWLTAIVFLPVTAFGVVLRIGRFPAPFRRA